MTILLGYTSTYSWNAFNLFLKKYWANFHLKCKKYATLIPFLAIISFYYASNLNFYLLYQPQGWSSRQSLTNVLGKHIVTVREIKLIQSPSCSVTNLELLLFFLLQLLLFEASNVILYIVHVSWTDSNNNLFVLDLVLNLRFFALVKMSISPPFQGGEILNK